ncbi:MAG: NAD(P)H-quinone oxidoreductase [Alphaproteobacteria bacterium]|nr:NAD(P)H-quinone oxidoreductase [Alphaproteobacteria bacterium]
MRAIEIAEFGPPEGLKPTGRPVPVAGPGEVLIKVHAAGVNRPDVLQRLGNYPPPPGASDIPGLEVAGEVVAEGPAQPDDNPGVPLPEIKVGDKVCALVTGGGYAEYAVAPKVTCLPWPEGYDAVRAAGILETSLTVWTNVFQRGRLTAGETLLVHGGSSGIGTTAIQLAKAFGARVFTTAGSEDKCRVCEELGAERGINYKTEDFAAIVKEAGGADVILDMIGGKYLEPNLDCLKLEGRLVLIATLGGRTAEVNLGKIMMKRLTVTGSTLRARSPAQKALVVTEVWEKAWPLLSAGTVKPIVHRVFPLDGAADAHRLMEESSHIGKLMLDLSAPAE